jgi:endogenous inhibitor of DNA gyrase (YacG/DUF329 family)
MKKKCLGCTTIIEQGWAKYCGNACYMRVQANRKAKRPDDFRKWIPQVNCATCGKEITNRGLQAKYCSKRCRLHAGHKLQRERSNAKKRALGLPVRGDIVPCVNPQCFNAAIYWGVRAYCSQRCKSYVQENKHWLGDGPSSRIWLYQCPDCSAAVLHRSQNGTPKVCPPCRVIRNKAINSRKAHARRAPGPAVLSVTELAERDGNRCHICCRKVDMNLSGKAKWGPTIEHIVPVSRGGTNEPGNLALAHRYCNTARGNRGHSQLLLVA